MPDVFGLAAGWVVENPGWVAAAAIAAILYVRMMRA
jgi:hypothetical protein